MLTEFQTSIVLLKFHNAHMLLHIHVDFPLKLLARRVSKEDYGVGFISFQLF